jgi:hypothetical protein
MATIFYPLLDALKNGEVVRRAVASCLNILAVVTGVVGAVGVVLIIKLSLDPSLPPEATLGGLLWAGIFAAIILATVQVFRYHAREIQDLGDGQFFVLPVASVLFRLSGEQCAMWFVGGGIGGFFLLLIAGQAAGLLMGAIGGPFAPSLGGAGFIAAASMLITAAVLALAALFGFYLLAEGTLVLADIANHVRRLLDLQEHTTGVKTPVGRRSAEVVVEPQERPADAPTPLPRRCPSCRAVAREPASRFCEQCGAPIDVNAS